MGAQGEPARARAAPPRNRGAARLLAAGVLLLAVAGGGLYASAWAESRIRVVTFNLFHGGHWSGLGGDARDLEARFRMVVEELRSLDPDLVGLQESSTGRGRGDVAERLARALGLEHAYAPATSRVFWPRWLGRVLVWALNFEEGPAVLSRFPIVAREVFDLPRCARGLDPRVLLRVEVRTPWGPLDVFSTHVSPGDDCQVSRIGEIVSARPGRVPAIVTGDFNASEDSGAIAALIGDAGWVDTFRAANPETPGPTVWQRIDAAGPTVSRRVDYVFLVPGGDLPARVAESRLVLRTPQRRGDGSALWPSDHYGVFTVLDVETGRAR